MGIPWKRVGAGLVAGVKVAGKYDARLAAVATAIEAVEARVNASGAEKKALVEAELDAVLEAELGLTDQQRAALKAVRSTLIDDYVTARNALAHYDASREAYAKAYEALKG